MTETDDPTQQPEQPELPDPDFDERDKPMIETDEDEASGEGPQETPQEELQAMEGDESYEYWGADHPGQ